MQKQSQFFQKQSDGSITETSTRLYEEISNGELDRSRIRRNDDGALTCLNYGLIHSTYESSDSLTVHLWGNNLQWTFDPHWDHSQIGQWAAKENSREFATSIIENTGYHISPPELVKMAKGREIIFTGGEPSVNADYIADIAELADQKQLTLVTNGTLSDELISMLGDKLGKTVVYLHSNANEFYVKHCKTSIKPVFEGIEALTRLGIFMEIATYILPGEMDTEKVLTSLARKVWNLNPNAVWKIKMFTPTYRILDKPQTPLKSLQLAQKVGKTTKLQTVIS